MYLLEKQKVPSSEEYSNVIDYRHFLIHRRLKADNYNLNIVFNCKEKKDVRGRTYLLTVSSWNNVNLVES
jgi:hypothetical protein